jgi:hypothetical protein
VNNDTTADQASCAEEGIDFIQSIANEAEPEPSKDDAYFEAKINEVINQTL